MTERQEQHLQYIKDTFTVEVDAKYRKGQEEHGGDLEDKDCLPLAMEEALDLPVYLITEMKRRRKALDIISQSYEMCMLVEVEDSPDEQYVNVEVVKEMLTNIAQAINPKTKDKV